MSEISRGQRYRILVRDEFTCRYCGRGAPEVELEVDHIQPRAANGSSERANLITACFDCNRGKRAKILPAALVEKLAGDLSPLPEAVGPKKRQPPKGPRYRYRSLRSDYEWESSFMAYWEVELDPISDDYLPSEVDASELFRMWVERIRGRCQDGLVPIHWFVEADHTLEMMPFAYDHFEGKYPHLRDFLGVFTWPESADSSERLDWLTLPVCDKRWDARHAHKGGFIQSATGWKPSILQPHVFLLSLSDTRRWEPA